MTLRVATIPADKPCVHYTVMPQETTQFERKDEHSMLTVEQ